MNKQKFCELVKDIKQKHLQSSSTGDNHYFENDKLPEGFKDVEDSVKNTLLFLYKEHQRCNLSFMQYTELSTIIQRCDLIKTEYYHDNDYYGNFETGYIAILTASDFYDTLKNIGVL